MLDIAPLVVPRLAYGFAKMNGVLLMPSATGIVCRHLPEAPFEALIEAQRVSGQIVSFAPITPAEFETALGTIYRDSATEAAQVAADADADLVSLADTAASVDDLLDQNDDAPVVRLINALLLEAVKEGASDVHIETEERRLIVRFRVDGVLREVNKGGRGGEIGGLHGANISSPTPSPARPAPLLTGCSGEI